MLSELPTFKSWTMHC